MTTGGVPWRARLPDLGIWSAVLVLGLVVIPLAVIEPRLAVVLVLLPVLAIVREHLPLVLGLLLPIYGIAFVPTTIFSLARLLVVAALLVVAFPLLRETLRWTNRGWFVLWAGLLLAAGVNTDPATAAGALTSGLAVLAAGSIVSLRKTAQLLLGFRIAVVASAVAALLASAGATGLVAPVVQNYGQWGFSYRSTAFSYELAIGLVIWLFATVRSGRHRAAWAVEGGVLVGALLVSGGRGGLVAAVLVLVLALTSVQVRRRASVSLLGLSVLTLVAVSTSNSILSLDRLIGYGGNSTRTLNTDYSAGRLEIFSSAVDAIMRNPVFGSGFDAKVPSADGAVLSAPHNAILTMMLYGGIICGVGALIVLLTAARHCVREMRSTTGIQLVGAVLAVFLVRSVVESGGVFLGLSGSLLFAAMVAEARYSRIAASACSVGASPRVDRVSPR